MKNIRSSFLLILQTLLIISAHVQAQPEKAEAGIKSIMQEIPVMGLSVAVVKNNKIIYTQSFGTKSRENNAPLTNECIFRIASISKSFSATSIMQLAERKKLSIDQDVSELIGFKVRNPKFNKPLYIFEQQQSVSEEDLICQAIKKTFEGLIEANKIERKPAGLDKLTVGVKCGGSERR
jgi:altronate dehydratase